MASTRAPEPGTPLTEQELRVAELVSRGLSNAEVGQTLWLTEETVKTHLYRGTRRIGARGRAHYVALLLSAGLIPPVRAEHPLRTRRLK